MFLNHSQLLHCRKLFLREYQVQASIGAFEHEKKQTQPVIINAEIYIPLSECTPKEDKLKEVLNYDLIRKDIDECIAQEHIHLQETLCDRIVKKLLSHPTILAVRISTEKPDAYPNCQAVGVEVFQIKSVDQSKLSHL